MYICMCMYDCHFSECVLVYHTDITVCTMYNVQNVNCFKVSNVYTVIHEFMYFVITSVNVLNVRALMMLCLLLVRPLYYGCCHGVCK